MPTRRRYEDIPIECLRAIVTIADQGSFRGATEVLGLSQPAISAQVRRLERLIGARVFEKSPRGVGLTERGKTVDRYARRILVLGDQIKAHSGASEGHVLRIGMQNFFVEKTLTTVIEKCSAAYVGGSIQFVCDVSSSIRDQLARGYLDLAFVMAPPDFPVPAHSEWTEKIVWAAAPGVRPALDKSIPLIVLPGGNIDRIAIAALEQKGMSHTIAFSASDTTARKEAALARVGIMAAPERFIPEGLEPIEDTFMPKLPALRAGILYKEGLDIARITPLANALEAAVCPIQTTRAVSPRVVVSNERSPTPRGGVPSMIKF